MSMSTKSPPRLTMAQLDERIQRIEVTLATLARALAVYQDRGSGWFDVLDLWHETLEWFSAPYHVDLVTLPEDDPSPSAIDEIEQKFDEATSHLQPSEEAPNEQEAQAPVEAGDAAP